MSKGKEYLKNTLVLFLGKFCTQFSSFLLIPIFTRFLTTSDYGYTDLLLTYINLFVPILLLRIDNAAFRFLIDERDNKKDDDKSYTITNTALILFIATISLLLFYSILNLFLEIKYFHLLTLNIFTLFSSSILLQTARGLGKNLDFSLGSIIAGLSNLIINIILIVFFHFDARAIFIASIISNLFCSIYLIFKIRVYKYITPNKIDRLKLKKMLKYSIPMIPNTLSWWIVDVSDRSIISFILGVSTNGIYTVACKISNILNSIFNIFNMSWTETVALHINDKDADKFFDEMINKLFFLFTSIGLVIIGLLPIFYNVIIGQNFTEAYQYIPILIIAGNGSVLSWLCGGIYIAKKETKKVAKTTILSAVLNLFLHLILIRFIGLYAATISTLFAYTFSAIYRYYDCQQFIKFKLNKQLGFSTILLYTIILLFYYSKLPFLYILSGIISILTTLIINKTIIKSLLNLLIDKSKRRKKQ